MARSHHRQMQLQLRHGSSLAHGAAQLFRAHARIHPQPLHHPRRDRQIYRQQAKALTSSRQHQQRHFPTSHAILLQHLQLRLALCQQGGHCQARAARHCQGCYQEKGKRDPE